MPFVGLESCSHLASCIGASCCSSTGASSHANKPLSHGAVALEALPAATGQWLPADDMEARRAASGGQYMADEPVRVTQGDPLSSVWTTASQASHNHSSVLAATQVLAGGERGWCAGCVYGLPQACCRGHVSCLAAKNGRRGGSLLPDRQARSFSNHAHLPQLALCKSGALHGMPGRRGRSLLLYADDPDLLPSRDIGSVCQHASLLLLWRQLAAACHAVCCLSNSLVMCECGTCMRCFLLSSLMLVGCRPWRRGCGIPQQPWQPRQRPTAAAPSATSLDNTGERMGGGPRRRRSCSLSSPIR